ncbi:Endoribonuclease L-PSP/chorismate mutase-like protein [Schizophyllum amplum]|uniref:Endoribonuclease L-PSP/chorismate mutase-like protein n=1 Tax=Schizophyllum amplum TaxID=97359 RepID=A0A550CFE3_9AGAR|nr:Endoribonuclease L-PSP/chorismate mutase-like protein [Auriculariopsis ampla]
MKFSTTLLALATAFAAPFVAAQQANFTSPLGVEIYNPADGIDATGPWSLMSVAGNTVYVAGMRGIYPSNNSMAEVGYPRIKQAFLNMQYLAEYAGAELADCSRVVVYTTDMFRYRPIVNAVQEELWKNGTYPPRTIIEVSRLNQDDIVEVEGTFYLGTGGAKYV